MYKYVDTNVIKLDILVNSRVSFVFGKASFLVFDHAPWWLY